VGRTWHAADYRISFAKNKTDWRCFYAGCLLNVYGCLPEWDRLRHYQGKGREFYECCILMADRFPVHFGFLDAWVSGDGFSGPVRDARPKPTRTIFASDNIYALDWVMGEKMEINPALNSVIQEAMFRWGPIHLTRTGNMTPWYPWDNLRPFVVFALDALEESYGAGRFFLGLFASAQDARFPPRVRGQRLSAPFRALARLFEPLAVKRTAGPKVQKEKLELQKSI
jgi:hypothetical protein